MFSLYSLLYGCQSSLSLITNATNHEGIVIFVRLRMNNAVKD